MVWEEYSGDEYDGPGFDSMSPHDRSEPLPVRSGEGGVAE